MELIILSATFHESFNNIKSIIRQSREELALLMALQYFDVYIGSSTYPVVVFTDHNPLVFLARMYNQNQRLMRWSLIVQGYNLIIKHKKGVENVIADALSRV